MTRFVLSALVLVSVPSLGLAAAGAHAVPRSTATATAPVTVSLTSPVRTSPLHDRLVLAGASTAPAGTAVLLQRQVGADWQTVGRGTLDDSQRFGVGLVPNTTGPWILRATVSGIPSGRVRVDVVREWVVSATARSAYVLTGATATIDVTVTPRRPNTAVTLQCASAGDWTEVATQRVGHDSTTSFQVPMAVAGVRTCRAVKAAGESLGAGTSDPVRLEAGKVALSPGTQVVTPAQQGQLLSWSPDTGVLVLRAGDLADSLQVGDIIASGPTAMTPEGLLRRVTGTTYLASGATQLTTVQAKVPDAVGATDGLIHAAGTIYTQSDLTSGAPSAAPARAGRSTTAAAGPRRVGGQGHPATPNAPFVLSQHLHTELTAQGPLFPLPFKPVKLVVQGSGTAVVDADVALSTDAELDWDQSWFTLNKARFVLHNKVDGKVEFSENQALSVEAELTIAAGVTFVDFQLGPLPVVFTNRTSFPLTLESKVSGNLPTITTASSSWSDIGFDYTPDTGLQAIDERGSTPSADPGSDWDLLPSFEVDASVGIKQQEDLYGVAGLEGKLAGYGKFELNLPRCAISLGLRLEIGLEVGLSLLGINSTVALTNDLPGIEWTPCPAEPDPVIKTDSLPEAMLNVPYSQQLDLEEAAAGAWSVQSGDLPPGLTLNLDGQISGTPSQAGTFPFTVAFTDVNQRTATRDLTIVVTDLQLDTTSLPSMVTGLSVSSPIDASGGTTPYTFVATSGVPEGLTLDEAGTLVGTPTRTGSGTMSVTVTDANGATATGDVTWTVTDAPPPVDPAAGGLVSVGTPPPACLGACGTSWGDPHLVTFDGVAFDAQRVGELTLVKSTADDLEVQVRQQPWNGSSAVSVNTATAMRVAGHRVTFELVNGALQTRVDGALQPAGTVALPGGGSLVLDSSHGLVTWPDGSSVNVTDNATYLTLRVSMAAARAGQLTGLLGDADHDPADDHRTRGGDVVPLDTPMAQLLSSFVDTWRITQADSLFDYAPGQTTETFTDLDFPRQAASVSALPADAVSAAFQACLNAGVTGQDALNACALDVAMTGDVQAAVGALVAQYGQPTGPSVIKDGGFEDPAINGAYATYSAPAAIGAWRLTSGGVDLLQSYTTPAEGRQSVDLNSCSPGRLEQDVTLQPGTTYVVTLQHAGSGVPFHVEVGGATVLNVPTTDGRWTRASSTFQVTGSAQTFAIQSDGGSCWGPYIDDVAVYPVP